MVETEKEYILQWSGHAESITEKLRHYVSKQSLVDVTLLCQDEKLRVHKLVLASTSGYFEELLEQDLGQEPIILLKDLHFDILKAMVEFMYCGETTIAHCHLKSLLDAAQVFKVKDLESIVNIMIDDNESCEENDTQVLSSDIEEDCGETSDASTPLSPTNNSLDIKLNKNNVPDTNNILTNNLFDDTSLKLNDNNTTTSDNDNSHEKILNEVEKSTKIDDKNTNILDDNNYKLHNIDCNDLSTVVGECLKVYSHKKRTSSPSSSSSSSNNDKNKNLNIFEMISSQGLTTNGIDLSCDINCDITLPSILEMDQTTDMSIWNLGNDKHKNTRDDLFNISDFSYSKSVRKMKELFSIENRNISVKRKPVLRRSVRLNQVDNDDSLNNNNNNNNNNSNQINKSRKKYKNNYSLKSIKAKRKNKESDENNVNLRKTVNSRSLRSSSKLVSKSNERCTLSRLDKDEKSSKSQKLNDVKMEEIGDVEAAVGPLKLNTIATVDRSLWGDMSDVIENRENGSRILPDYAPSKEIPFAVGLLPLRAALERMQATLDYQPRKTRTSRDFKLNI